MNDFNRADYLTPRELAEIRGVSPQTIYAQTKRGLKDYTITHNNKIYISRKALADLEINQQSTQNQPIINPKSTDNQQSINEISTDNQPEINQESTDNQPAPIGNTDDFTREQLNKKDEIISSLLEQIKELQSQNGDLVELLKREQEINYNNQILIGQAQLLPAPKEKKKGLFGKIFGKKEKEQ